jgi:hypothetical protein
MNKKKQNVSGFQMRSKKFVSYTLSSDEEDENSNEQSSDEEFDIDKYNMMEASYDTTVDSNWKKKTICKTNRDINDSRLVMEVEIKEEKESQNSYPWVKELKNLDDEAGKSNVSSINIHFCCSLTSVCHT